jgi:hypothetical protein
LILLSPNHIQPFDRRVATPIPKYITETTTFFIMSAENNTGFSLQNPAASGGSAETKGKGKSLATDNVEDNSMAVDDDEDDDDKDEESDEVGFQTQHCRFEVPFGASAN